MYGRANPDLTAVPSFLASVRRTFLSCLISRQITLAALVLAFQAGAVFAGQARSAVPERIPLKRSVQIVNGFGINTPLPRQPYLPWDRRWWTRLFDAGYGWVRIGQYENSSEQTSWDWVEQNRGIYRISPEVDDYVDSLVENGVKVQLQLLYGNPMYTSPRVVCRTLFNVRRRELTRPMKASLRSSGGRLRPSKSRASLSTPCSS